jgi:hypothetical protein
LLNFLRERASNRKLRLFAVACCRCIWHLIDAPRQQATELAERYADGQATKEQLDAAKAALNAGILHVPLWAVLRGSARLAARDMPATAARLETAASLEAGVQPDPDDYADDLERWSAEDSVWRERHAASLLKQVPLLYDIFGNPFRPVTVDLSWLTATVVSLAQAIYDERAFDRLPILADALEDAGCTNSNFLNHCRQPGEHVRGCWCVDLILGKE